MRRKKRRFRGRVVTLNLPSVYMGLCIIAGILSPFLFIQAGISLPQPSAAHLLNAMSHCISGFASETPPSISLNAYTILADSILSIKASESMSKKYAAQYSGVIKKAEAVQPSEQPAAASESVSEADVSAKGITFINTPGYEVSAADLLTAPLKFSQNPTVLIVHTHTSEAYAESEGARSRDEDLNVVSVGAAIAEALKKEGIHVIHDKTQNDNPSYNQSYKNTLSVIESNLTAHPEIEIVLDIHRDYIKQESGTLLKPTITDKSGEKAAQIMFVIGTDNMGLYHPEWRHNLAFAVQIQNALNTIQPGLCRSVNIRTERFNQHATPGSMIIEVGTGVNTIQEAKRSGTIIGKGIATVLNSR